MSASQAAPEQMTQLFYYDPDGIAVECNFPAAETV